MTQKTRGTVGIVTGDMFARNEIKVGQELILETDCAEDLTVQKVRVRQFKNGEVILDCEDGDWEAFCLDGFNEDPVQEAQAYQRLYLVDQLLCGELMLINVERGTVVATGNLETITAKVLDFRQGGGDKLVSKLRVVKVADLKAVKLGLIL